MYLGDPWVVTATTRRTLRSRGAKRDWSGETYNAIQYGLENETGLIDYDQVASLAREHKPKVIVAGFSAYSRSVDGKRFRDIADRLASQSYCVASPPRVGCQGSRGFSVILSC